MTAFKKSKDVWISQDWVEALFQDGLEHIRLEVYGIQPQANVNVSKPVKYKLTLEHA